MKRRVVCFSALILSIVFAPATLQAQKGGTVVTPNSVCGDCGPEDGGGGTGGGGSTGPNYYLSWSSPYTSAQVDVGGTPDRVGVGAVVFNNTMYLSYTGRSCKGISNPIPGGPVCLVQAGGGPIMLSTATDQNPGPKQMVTPGNAILPSKVNTAITVFNQQLYYVGTDGSGNVFWLHSPDGTNWGNENHYCMTGAGSGPNVAVYHNYLYIAVNKGNQLVICKVDSNDGASVLYPSTVSFNMAPEIGVYNDTLFVGFQPTDDGHAVTLYTSNDGSSFNLNMGASSDQTSTTPSFVTHNGALYLGFRTNDGDHKFLYKYSTDGYNFSSSIDPHYTMGGPPRLIEYNGVLYNWFAQNDTDQWLYSSVAQ